MLPLLRHVFVVEVNVDHGAMHMRVAQALLHIADVPVCADQLRRMRMSQHVCMEWKLVLAAVMLEHRFNGVAVQRATVSNPAALVSRRFLEDDEKMVRIKVVLQDEMIQESHQPRR